MCFMNTIHEPCQKINQTSGLPARSDAYRAAQSQKIVSRGIVLSM